MPIWRSLQTVPAIVRWPAKWFLFLSVLFLTLYPRPNLLVRQIQHIRNLNALPDPNASALAPVRERFQQYLSARNVGRADNARMLEAVNAFVRAEIPYAWDWDVWGVADYLPTVDEVIAKGREDCDGRAVLAASLLRAEGVPANLVADTRHMWVSTPIGETMNPLGPPILRNDGKRTRIDWVRLIDLGPPAFGISVFPLRRELIILLTAWILLLPARPRLWSTLSSLVLMVQALFVIRMAGANPLYPSLTGIHLGLLNAAAGVVLLAWIGRQATTKTDSVPTGLYAIEEAS
jgi:hypothetical protein